VLLLDPKESVLRGNAAAALGEIGGAVSENDLLNLLHDDDVYPRIRAIMALAKLGTDRCLDPLVQMLRAPEANVRDLAAKALWIVTRRLGYGIDGSALGEDAGAWHEAIAARRAGG
jgi:HEAT repeat protein